MAKALRYVTKVDIFSLVVVRVVERLVFVLWLAAKAFLFLWGDEYRAYRKDVLYGR